MSMNLKKKDFFQATVLKFGESLGGWMLAANA